jgi:hypothetical protein
MKDRDFDAPNLDIMREPHGRSRLFLEDDPPILVEDDASMSVGPSPAKRPSRASAVFLFLFVFVVGAGVTGALAWRSYGDQAMDMIRAWALPTATSKPTAPSEGFAELQQQLKSITVELAAVRHTLEQFVSNQDQLTRKQEEMAHKQEQMTQAIAALQMAKQDITHKTSPPPASNKPVQVPVAKPGQQPARLSTQDSSKPKQISPPQSLLPPKQ